MSGKPLHVPAHGPVPSQAVRPFLGGPMTGLHVPRAPSPSQASHWPLHALSQQYPSTQLPEAHAMASVHFAPIALFAQASPMQRAPGAQSASFAQVVVQATPLSSQRNGVQSIVSGSHSPDALHLAA